MIGIEEYRRTKVQLQMVREPVGLPSLVTKRKVGYVACQGSARSTYVPQASFVQRNVAAMELHSHFALVLTSIHHQVLMLLLRDDAAVVVVVVALLRAHGVMVVIPSEIPVVNVQVK